MKSNLPSQSVPFYRHPAWLLGLLAFVTFIGLVAGRVTPFLSFARVPLLSLALFAVIVPALATRNLKSLLIGAYDLSGFKDGLILGLLLVLCGMTIYTTATLCMEVGPARFEDSGIVHLSLWAKSVLGLLIWCGILGNAALARSASGSPGKSLKVAPDTLEKQRWSTIGLLIGMALAGLGWVGIEGFVQNLQGDLNEVVKVHPWLTPIKSVTDWLKSLPCASLCRGYVALSDNTMGVELKHAGAVLGFLVTGALYLSLRRFSMIAIGYVLLLLVVLTWGLTALSFFLDFFRVPLLIPLGFWLLFATFHPKTDHYYPILSSDPEAHPKTNPPLNPAEVLEQAVGRDEPIILVAAAGGGIQSAAWTAQVLTGVEEHCLKQQAKTRFSQAVKLLSGVSGGSVGSMFFAASYQNGAIPAHILPSVRQAAFGSSLSEAAKGLAYGDLLRALAPFWVRDVYRDRGQALERAWMMNAGCSHRHNVESAKNILSENLDQATLNGWQEDVRHGIRPAVIFNSTSVETGQRLAFTTAPYNPDPILPDDQLNPSPPIGLIDFSTRYDRADVLISTAARLSATFTYVSPAARPLSANSLNWKSRQSPDHQAQLKSDDSQPLHLVDGGYNENSGLGGLVTWLKNGLEELARKESKRLPKEILILTIGAFPATKNPPVANQRGAIFQFEAPFLTLESMQGKGHTAAAWREFELLQEVWAEHNVKLTPIDFTFSGSEPPLSWHLRDCDKMNITNAWEGLPEKQARLAAIDQFLALRGDQPLDLETPTKYISALSTSVHGR
jgi:Patatin-like phospholipase